MALRLEGRVLRGRRAARGAVTVAGGALAEGGAATTRVLPPGWTVCPGMVDVQVNGYGGAEVGEDPDAIAAVAAALPSAGVTAFCPTLVSRDDAGYRRAAAALAAARVAPHAARPLAPHLEGPFLSPRRAGVHDPAVLRPPDPDALARLLAAFSPALVTLAPELPGGLAAVQQVARAGAVACVGHTEADGDAGRAAIGAGARMLTHAMNAMRGIESRAPSALTAFLADPRTRVGLIADGVHVHPEVAAVLARAAGRRLVLVSDAVAPAGAPPGDYPLAGRMVTSDGTTVLWEGRLAGSAAGLGRGPAVLAGAGVGRAAALAAAVEAPRRLLGLPAALAAGDPADLVVVDDGLVPRLTLVGGRVAFADPALPFDVPGPGEPV